MAVDFRDQEENIAKARAGLLNVEYFDLRGQNTELLENVLDPKEMRALKIAPLERTLGLYLPLRSRLINQLWINSRQPLLAMSWVQN